MGAFGDHRLDGQHQTGAEQRPRSGCAVIGNLGLLVHFLPDPVTDQIADDPVPVLLGVGLDSIADIADVVALLHRRDAEHEALLGDAHQALGRFGNRSDRERNRRVRDVAFERRPDIDREQLALAQNARARDAVHDLIIDRGANRVFVAVVADERGNAAKRADRVLGEAIDIARRHAGFDGRHEHLEGFRGDLAAAAHHFDLARRFDRDHA